MAHEERALEWAEHRFLRRRGLLSLVEDLHGHLLWVGVAPPNERGALAAGLTEPPWVPFVVAEDLVAARS